MSDKAYYDQLVLERGLREAFDVAVDDVLKLRVALADAEERAERDGSIVDNLWRKP